MTLFHRPHRTPVILAALAVLGALVSACTPITTSIISTIVPAAATRLIPPTDTPEAALPAAPTLTSTRASTFTPAATPSPLPDAALSKVKFIGLSWQPNYDLLISFQFPGAVNASDYRMTLENKEYTCEVLPQYPDRLYCYGQGLNVLKLATARIYPKGSDNPGFEKDLSIPFFDTSGNVNGPEPLPTLPGQ